MSRGSGDEGERIMGLALVVGVPSGVVAGTICGVLFGGVYAVIGVVAGAAAGLVVGLVSGSRARERTRDLSYSPGQAWITGGQRTGETLPRTYIHPGEYRTRAVGTWGVTATASSFVLKGRARASSDAD